MDSLITAAARALSVGDPIAALNRVALRDDAPALALRGIAMAQLGELPRARALVRRAAREFGAREPVARARCVVAEAEIALAARELAWPATRLQAARRTLARHGDRVNAAYAVHLEMRRLLLMGRIAEAERWKERLDPAILPPALRAAYELVVAGIAIRGVRAREARVALLRAESAARSAGIPPLVAEVESVARILDAPAARIVSGEEEDRPILLEEVESIFASDALIVDACRSTVRAGGATISLGSRPVLFALARTLAEAWPGDASRRSLLSRGFGATFADDSHRARLRVEMGRLRSELKMLAAVSATRDGFVLEPHGGRHVLVLAHPVEEEHAPVLALLADGEPWSSSSLALALGTSQRTVQRALESLAASGRAQSFGRGRARRWSMPPVPGFATTLLLPAFPPDS